MYFVKYYIPVRLQQKEATRRVQTYTKRLSLYVICQPVFIYLKCRLQINNVLSQ